MAHYPACVLTIVCGVAVLYIGQQYRKSAKSRASLPLPPGPPGLPWIGNVIGVNADKPWLTYSDWAKTYGDLAYSRLLGRDIIIVNSRKIANDLLESRSKNYSDRPHFITNDLCGIGFNSAMLPYGDRWRLHRRFFHQTFRFDAVSEFSTVHHHRACQLLRQLLDAPEQLSEHVFEYTASVILMSVYNHEPPSEDDELLDIVAKVLEIVVPAMSPLVAVVVDAFPALLNLPAWLPGMSFKRRMAIARDFSVQYIEKPFAHSLRKELVGDVAPSMVHNALWNAGNKGRSPNKVWMKDLKEAAATAFLAASETSNSVLMTFFLVMIAHPEVQKKAQEQIDGVVGWARLPTIEDRVSLPYVDAIFCEVLRFSPPIPLGAPHATVDADIYAGFHIPKGAMVIANIWSMLHDESKYPNPHAFLPERFLNDDGSLKPNDVENIVFGFGRRICVGRHFADASIWAAIAKVLAVFTILKPLDENGTEVSVELKFSGGLGVHPLPFRSRIVSRVPGMNVEQLEELIAASSN